MKTRTDDYPSYFSEFPNEIEIQKIQDDLWKVFQFYIAGHIDTTSSNKLLETSQVYQSLKTYIDLSHKMLKSVVEDYQTLKSLNLPKGMDKDIRSALELIILTVKPEKIFLVQHDDDVKPESQIMIDLIVILSNKSIRKFDELDPLISFALSDTKGLSFYLYVSSRLAEAFEEGLLYFILNCQRKNLIYDDGQKPLPSINPVKLFENSKKAEATFLSNHEIANSFFENAKHLNHQKNFSLSCFMLQQATELSIRALITAFRGVDKKTHSI